MKRLIPLLLILTLVLGLAACGGDPATPADNSGSASNSENAGNSGNSGSSGSDSSNDPAPVDPGSVPAVITADWLNSIPESDPADFEFVNDGDGLRLNAYNGSATAVAVPATVDGKPVVSAAFGVFSSGVHSEVRAVRFPATLRELNGTFSGNENIEVVICEGLEVCGDMTFLQCPKLHTLVLGDALKTVGAQNFVVCDSLEEVYIAPSVTEIYSCFIECPKLTLVGQAGSYIEELAKEMEIPFRAK